MFEEDIKDSEEYVSITVAAKILDVSAGTLRNWSNRGNIPYLRTKGGHRRFSMSVLKNFVKPALEYIGSPTPQVVPSYVVDAVHTLRLYDDEALRHLLVSEIPEILDAIKVIDEYIIGTNTSVEEEVISEPVIEENMVEVPEYVDESEVEPVVAGEES